LWSSSLDMLDSLQDNYQLELGMRWAQSYIWCELWLYGKQ
jgi:hypothetical protein